jgi:hypothetical protein
MQYFYFLPGNSAPIKLHWRRTLVLHIFTQQKNAVYITKKHFHPSHLILLATGCKKCTAKTQCPD